MESAGAFIGIERFTGLCGELVALASTGATEGAAGLLSEIEAKYIRVKPVLRRWLGR